MLSHNTIYQSILSSIIHITVFSNPSQNEIPYLFLILWPTFPTNFTWNCVKSFYLQRIFQNIGYERTCFFFNNLVLSVVKYPFFFFELSYIFHNFENMKFPTFPDFFYPFPNSWLCWPIPYLFNALKSFKCDSWLFQDVPYPWEPWYYTFWIIMQHNPSECLENKNKHLITHRSYGKFTEPITLLTLANELLQTLANGHAH